MVFGKQDPVYRVFVACMLGCSMADFVPFSHMVKLALDRSVHKQPVGWPLLVICECVLSRLLVVHAQDTPALEWSSLTDCL